MELAKHDFKLQLIANMIKEQLYWENMFFILKLLLEIYKMSFLLIKPI